VFSNVLTKRNSVLIASYILKGWRYYIQYLVMRFRISGAVPPFLSGKNIGWGCSRIGCWGRYSAKRDEVTWGGEDCILRGLIFWRSVDCASWYIIESTPTWYLLLSLF
jgi:hypothetical protein